MEKVLTALENDIDSLADSIDWIAKRRLYEGFRERHSLEWSDPRWLLSICSTMIYGRKRLGTERIEASFYRWR